jgi:hypothetical protein
VARKEVLGLNLARPRAEERGSGGGDGGLEERGRLAGRTDGGAGEPRTACVTAQGGAGAMRRILTAATTRWRRRNWEMAVGIGRGEERERGGKR